MLWCTIPGHKGHLSARDDSLRVYVCAAGLTQPFGVDGGGLKKKSRYKIAELLAAAAATVRR